MPSHPTRRGLLALVILVVFAVLAGPVFAKNTYEIKDPLEGDPGDGVLSPIKPAFRDPLAGETAICTATDADGATWRLPVFVLPAGPGGLPTVFAAPGDVWRFFRWSHAPFGPDGGRWHHAR